MIALIPWQHHSSRLEVQIFALACENPNVKNLFDLINISLSYTLFYSKHLNYFKMYVIFTDLWATESHHHYLVI